MMINHKNKSKERIFVALVNQKGMKFCGKCHNWNNPDYCKLMGTTSSTHAKNLHKDR